MLRTKLLGRPKNLYPGINSWTIWRIIRDFLMKTLKKLKKLKGNISKFIVSLYSNIF